MAAGFATVKEVLSGDTLVLIGQPKSGPPPEIRLTLASVQAPRLGNSGKGGETKDEAFAWKSREFLRYACIGKQVSFTVEYSVPSINRQFGSVRLTTGTKENLCVVVAREGWARAKKDSDEKERSADYDEIVRFGDIAEQQGRGIFNKDPAAIQASIRNVTYELPNPSGFLQKIKGIPQKAIVEYVRDGGSFKVLLVDHMTYITYGLAGVQCPRVSGGNDGSDSGGEPFGREAKYFTEIRLLNRDVTVITNGVDERFNMFFGSMDHPAGDISVELLKNGLARTADWSMQYTSLDRASVLRAVTKTARDQRLRIWKSYVAPKISGAKNYEGEVAEVVSGDTLIIRVGSPDQLADRPWECEERRISLSSIRAPRLGARSRNESDAPYAYEAREFLRSRVQGRKVEVSVEYERAPPENATGLAALPRKFGTVTAEGRKGKMNLAEMLVEEGLAEVLRHRADDERSAHYDELSAAFIKAKDAKKGLNNPKATKEERRIVDLTSNATQAKSHLSSLQQVKPGQYKAGMHKAIVEYVINASRFRVFIPSENVLVNFALGGIVTPQGPRNAAKGRPATEGEEFATEALALTRSLTLQREVVVEIETMDKGGTCIGQVYVKKGEETALLSVVLMKAGLASLNDYTHRFTSCSDQLIREQAEAQRKRLNIWKDWVEPKEEEIPKPDASGRTDLLSIVISEIVSGSNFFAQNQSASAVAQLESIEKELETLGQQIGTTPGGAGSGIIEPKKGMNCIALFDDGTGNKWFRAKILNIRTEDGVENVHVRYIDYGNEETVLMERLRTPANQSIFSNPPIAQECELAFLKVPTLEKDFGREAAIALSDMCFSKKVTASTHGKTDDGKLRLVLFVSQEAEGDSEAEPLNINVELVAEGLAYVDSRQARYARGAEDQKIVSKLREAQENAHSEHLNLWRYGDVREDDE